MRKYRGRQAINEKTNNNNWIETKLNKTNEKEIAVVNTRTYESKNASSDDGGGGKMTLRLHV